MVLSVYSDNLKILSTLEKKLTHLDTSLNIKLLILNFSDTSKKRSPINLKFCRHICSIFKISCIYFERTLFICLKYIEHFTFQFSRFAIIFHIFVFYIIVSFELHFIACERKRYPLKIHTASGNWTIFNVK